MSRDAEPQLRSSRYAARPTFSTRDPGPCERACERESETDAGAGPVTPTSRRWRVSPYRQGFLSALLNRKLLTFWESDQLVDGDVLQRPPRAVPRRKKGGLRRAMNR